MQASWPRQAPSQAVATLPLIDIVKIGEAPAEPLPATSVRPLSGVRVFDLDPSSLQR